MGRQLWWRHPHGGSDEEGGRSSPVLAGHGLQGPLRIERLGGDGGIDEEELKGCVVPGVWFERQSLRQERYVRDQVTVYYTTHRNQRIQSHVCRLR